MFHLKEKINFAPSPYDDDDDDDDQQGLLANQPVLLELSCKSCVGLLQLKHFLLQRKVKVSPAQKGESFSCREK